MGIAQETFAQEVSKNSEGTSATQERAEDTSTFISPGQSKLRLVKLKGSLADLLEDHIPVLSTSAESQFVNPSLLRKLQGDIQSILSTEGYFSPQISFQKNSSGDSIDVIVHAGQQTLIKDVQMRFTGALAEAVTAGQATAIQKQKELEDAWLLPKGEAFRQSQWSEAKTQLIEALRANLYAGASLTASSANVDPETSSAVIELEIDSGAAFFFGDLQVSGLDRYPPWLLDRFNPPKKGDPYSSVRLLEFQRGLQNSAYFSTVIFNVEPDATKAAALPIEVLLSERQTRDVGLSAGYSTNTGFRTELTYRDRNVLDRLWDLRSAVRLEQKQQLSYADIYLPPTDQHRLDSFGVLFDRSNIEGLLQTRAAFAVKRTTTNGSIEQTLGAKYSEEKAVQTVAPGLRDENKSQALVASIGWTWRAVDDLLAPRKGHRAQFETMVSNQAIISDQSFVRVYGKYQYWHPIGKQDSVLLRLEMGKVFSGSGDSIPNGYLFRTGGSTSVRGYAYQSLGVKSGEAVLGGRIMGVASAEYVHWMGPTFGVAGFVDSGDAAADWKSFQAKQGIGLGARVKTLAGPIALDLAYGNKTKKFRLDFSIAIAF
ncbi:BamA/TamA family outer membrane protein [Undibacterium sp. LX40W]|uniref:BamA/TamA family outer membrane protein n=1 Tax=Undibacterium nitidum TaxID=2762298 RepID=A0A923KTS9_9BURK|nr:MULTISPECIES: BamA/TamA family outer membrane protein [Undibacterium]MBC3882556.1 BamA/TamA family outer membrane protein [Undibacterium nitidum]MBC3892837.1 BamA/TamA family outer membrane protein [Undibacterium sp. LX40W]